MTKPKTEQEADRLSFAVLEKMSKNHDDWCRKEAERIRNDPEFMDDPKPRTALVGKRLLICNRAWSKMSLGDSRLTDLRKGRYNRRRRSQDK